MRAFIFAEYFDLQHALARKVGNRDSRDSLIGHISFPDPADIAGLGVGCEYWGRRAEYARASAGHARACAEYARSEWSKRNYLRMATKYDQQANMAEGVEKRIRNRAAA